MSEPEVSDDDELAPSSPAPPPPSQKKGTRSRPAVGGDEEGSAPPCCGPVWQASTRRSSRCSPPVNVCGTGENGKLREQEGGWRRR